MTVTPNTIEDYAYSIRFQEGAGIFNLPEATEPGMPVTHDQVLKLIQLKLMGGEGMDPDQLAAFEKSIQAGNAAQLETLNNNIRAVNDNLSTYKRIAAEDLARQLRDYVKLAAYQQKIQDIEQQLAALKTEADATKTEADKAAKDARQAADSAKVSNSGTAPDGSNQALLEMYEGLGDLIGTDFRPKDQSDAVLGEGKPNLMSLLYKWIGPDFEDTPGNRPIEHESLQAQIAKTNNLMAEVTGTQEATSQDGKLLRSHVQAWFFHLIFSLYEYFSFPPQFDGDNDTATVRALRYHTEVKQATGIDDEKIQYYVNLPVTKIALDNGAIAYQIAHGLLTDHLILQASNRLSGEPALVNWSVVHPQNKDGQKSIEYVWIVFKEEIPASEYTIMIKGRPHEHHGSLSEPDQDTAQTLFETDRIDQVRSVA